MSNYPDNFNRTNMDFSAGMTANAVLDEIDALAKHMIACADYVTRIPSVDVSQKEWGKFVGSVEDLISDLLGDTRQELMEVAGWRERPKSMVQHYSKVSAPDVLLPLPNKAGDGPRVSAIMREEFGQQFEHLFNADGSVK